MAFFETVSRELFLTFATAMAPVVELRGAIPLGTAAAILGSLIPAPLIILLARRAADFFRETRFFGPKIDWLERRAHRKGRLVRKYRLLGLVILAGVPPAGHRSLDRVVGCGGAEHPDAPRPAGHCAGAGRGGSCHHRPNAGGRSPLVVTFFKEDIS